MLVGEEVLLHRRGRLLSSHVISCVKTLLHVNLARQQLMLLAHLSRLGLLLYGQYLIEATGAQTKLLVTMNDTGNAFVHVIFAAELDCLSLHTFNECIALSFFTHAFTQVLRNVQALLVVAHA